MAFERAPGPASVFGVRNFARLARSGLSFLTGLAREHGDVVRVPLLGKPYFLVSHPEDIEQVFLQQHKRVIKDFYTRALSRALGEGLINSEGETWRTHRKLASFAFTPRRIASYTDTMVAVGQRIIDRWQPDRVIDIHAEMSRLTMEVVGQVLFGADVDDKVRDVGRAMETINHFFAHSLEMFTDAPDWLPTPTMRRFHASLAIIDDIIYGLISQRRQTEHLDAERPRNLLDALLLAQADSGIALTDTQLRDQCVTLFLAGHETTSLALVHALYFLSQYPAVEERFHRELTEVLDGRPPGPADAKRLVYTDRVIKEAMRLFPPVWGIGREVLEEISLSGYRIPRGSQIISAQWVVHRDPRWFPEPEVFDPDRFAPERVKERPRLAYFPFGAGPRICIGNHFATTEAIVLLALIGQRFRPRYQLARKPDFKPAVTLLPRDGGWPMRLLPR